MARLNWTELLTTHRISFIERGANVKRGEVNIKCPLCGSADPSYHMGLNLTNGFWACWRNSAHRGKSPVRLIMALLKVPYYKARELAGLGEDFTDPEGFSALAGRLLRGEVTAKEERRKRVSWPRDARPINAAISYRAWKYLSEDRGFGPNTAKLVEEYDLRVCNSHPWGDRILIPYFLDGNLVTWTGRSVINHPIRYRDLETHESVRAPKETLFNIDSAHEAGGRVLLAVEGPFDALKLDFYGRAVGVRAVAFSTNSMTEDQLYMLAAIADNFPKLMVMHDQTNTATGAVHSMTLKARISHIAHAQTCSPPFGVKDGGALSRKQAVQFTDELSQ